MRERPQRSSARSRPPNGPGCKAGSARLDEQLRPTYESRLEQLRQLDATWQAASPNLPQLLELYDSIAYLTRLLEQIAEKKFQLDVA